MREWENTEGDSVFEGGGYIRACVRFDVICDGIPPSVSKNPRAA